MPVIFLQQSTDFFQSLLMWVYPGFRWKAGGFLVESQQVPGGKPVGFRWKAGGFPVESFSQENPAGFPPEFRRLSPGKSGLKSRWVPSGIPLGFR